MIARFERVEQVRGLSRRLHDDVDRAALGIGVLDRDRDALALFVNPKDDELSWLLFARDARRFNDEALDSRRKKLCVDDFEHRRSVGQDELPDNSIVFGITAEQAVIWIT